MYFLLSVAPADCCLASRLWQTVRCWTWRRATSARSFSQDPIPAPQRTDAICGSLLGTPQPLPPTTGFQRYEITFLFKKSFARPSNAMLTSNQLFNFPNNA